MKTAKQFLEDDFLLETEAARFLFAACRNEPIFDYHCHLIPAQIAENKQFRDLAEIWLGGDHYKWRMMRAFGVDEAYITGNAPAYEKYLQWARTVENLIGNPLYHWTHLELQRYFGIYEPLTERSAESIWNRANKKLASEELRVKGILKTFKVHTVGTTDDPADSLEYHKIIARGEAAIGRIETQVIPSFRPDKTINIEAGDFPGYIAKLGDAAGIPISKVDDVKEALKLRLEYFISLGCRSSDHAIAVTPCLMKDEAAISGIFKKALSGGSVTKEEAEAWKTYLLTYLANLYAEKNIVMQCHFSSLRNISGRLFKLLGPDCGNDVSHDALIAESLAGLLNHIEEKGALPKTILYTLNPKDYYPLSTIMGCFQDNRGGGVKGKFQLGSAWWFCDHIDGMEEQMRILANTGMLSLFVGMLTDSRSFLSYPRHEYFRRILCNILGDWVDKGMYPADEGKLTEIVKNISFRNARNFFNS